MNSTQALSYLTQTTWQEAIAFTIILICAGTLSLLIVYNIIYIGGKK